MRMALLLLSLFAPLAVANSCVADESFVFSKILQLGSFTYKMNYSSENDFGRFQLLQRGKAKLSIDGSHFYVNPNVPCGLPIAGSRVSRHFDRELMVVEWTGGAHCCHYLYIIALEEAPFLIQKIDLEHSELPDFEDLDGDGVVEIVMKDWTFAYWKASYALSPAPIVILKFDGRKWTYAPSLNKRNGSFLLESRKREIKRHFKHVMRDAAFGDREDTGAPVLLWDGLLTLIYSGQSREARSLLEASWPADNPNRHRFEYQFLEQLKQSPYYERLLALNNGTIL